MKQILFLLLFVPVLIFANPMYSPTWGFFLDLPEGYEYIDGDGKDRFSFLGPGGAMFDLVIYNGTFRTMADLINDINIRLDNYGDVDFFNYSDKNAALIELLFGNFSGWGLCIELPASGGQLPILLALAYGPADREDLDLFHMSALDSISPSMSERYYPGPIIDYSFPRGELIPVTITGGVSALIRENDVEAAKVLIEREFNLLRLYAETPIWPEAWIRYYRFIYRDSWDRIANPVFALIRHLGGVNFNTDDEKRAFAQRALTFIQNFNYERDFDGSDFLNLVTVISEGRGNCDNFSMLWAVILANAGIRSAIMVSPYHSHAMGLADLPGEGARFETSGTRWLVAETTDKIDIGLIDQEMSDPNHWLGIIFH